MRPSPRAAVALFIVGLTVWGCASSGGSSGPRRNPDLITRAELDELGGTISAYQAIERLRPNWLRVRGSERATLFMDGVRQADVEYLRNIQASSIEQMRYRSPSDATTRYGTGVSGGVIEVTSARR